MTDGREQSPHKTPQASLPTEWLEVSSYFPTSYLRICKTSRPSPLFVPDATLTATCTPRLCPPGTARGNKLKQLVLTQQSDNARQRFGTANINCLRSQRQCISIQCPPISKRHFYLKGSQASPVCPSGNSDMYADVQGC